MGRKKIKIEPIQEGRNRQVTYLKRKAGLFKKAHELATLTDSSVAVIVFSHNGRLSQFSSGDMDQMLLRYTDFEGNIESKGPRDFAGGRDDDEDDEDDDKPNDHKYRGGPSGGGRGGGPGGSGGSGGAGSSGSGSGGAGAGTGSQGGPGGDSGPSGSTHNGQGSSGGSGNRTNDHSQPSGGQPSYTGTSRQGSSLENEQNSSWETTLAGDEDDASSSTSTSEITAPAEKGTLKAAVLSKGSRISKRSAPTSGPRAKAAKAKQQGYQDDANGGVGSAPRLQVPIRRSQRKPRADASVLMPMPMSSQPYPLTRPHGPMPSVLARSHSTGYPMYSSGMGYPSTVGGFIGAGGTGESPQSAPGSYNNSPYPSGASTPAGGGPWMHADAAAGTHHPIAGPSHMVHARRSSASQPREVMSMMPYAPRPNTASLVMDRGHGSSPDWQHPPHMYAAFSRPGQSMGGDAGMTGMEHPGPSSRGLVSARDLQVRLQLQQQRLLQGAGSLPPQPSPQDQQEAYIAPFAPDDGFGGGGEVSTLTSTSSRCGSVSSASLSMSRPGTDDYNSGAPPSACDTPLTGPVAFGGSTGAGGKSMEVGSSAQAALNDWIAQTLLPPPDASDEDASTMQVDGGAPFVKMGALAGDQLPSPAIPRTVSSQLMEAGLHTVTPRVAMTPEQ